MNTQSEFDFLKDQVERLNGVLSNYQENFLKDLQKSGSNKLRVILNSQIPPLLLEYDRIIYDLRTKLEENEKFMKQEEGRVFSVINENERLLKQMNEHQYDFQTPKSSNIPKNIERQVECLSMENKALSDLVTTYETEVNRLQGIITEHDMKPQTMIFNERMEEIKQKYQSSISDLENEVASLRVMKKDGNNEIVRLRKLCSEMEKDNIILAEKLKFEKEASEENLNQLNCSLNRIELMDKENKQLMENLVSLKTTLRSHEATKTEWSNALDNLESRYHEKEQQLYETNQKLKEAFQMAEDSSSDKKAAEIKELQAATECDRLRAVISGILEDAGARTREEVDIVKENCEKEMERIVEELNLCEQNRQELLAEIDKIKRSKSQLEQEMEQFHRAERERNLQDLSSAEASHERMLRAERERESLRLQCDNVGGNLDKERTEKQRLKEIHDLELANLQNKLCQLQTTCDKAQASADRFAKLLNSSEESASNSRRKYQESLKKSRHDYEILKQTFQIKQQELETRLASNEETQRHSTAEMRQILHKQQQLSSKWKEEAHTLTNQYEDRLGQLMKELERQKTRNSEMVVLLQESKQKILESHELIDEKKKTIDILDDRLRILDGNDEDRIDSVNTDPVSQKDQNWQLKHLKKQQQKIIRETVARSMKTKMMIECNVPL